MDSGKPEGQDSIPRDKAYRFRVLGQDIIIRTDKDFEYINSLIDFIERRASHISEPSFLKKVLLLLLDITDELFEEKEKMKRTNKRYQERVDYLLSLIPEKV